VKFCPECGYRLASGTEKYRPECGIKLQAGSSGKDDNASSTGIPILKEMYLMLDLLVVVILPVKK